MVVCNVVYYGMSEGQRRALGVLSSLARRRDGSALSRWVNVWKVNRRKRLGPLRMFAALAKPEGATRERSPQPVTFLLCRLPRCHDAGRLCSCWIFTSVRADPEMVHRRIHSWSPSPRKRACRFVPETIPTRTSNFDSTCISRKMT